LCVCVCVCVRARARALACVRACMRAGGSEILGGEGRREESEEARVERGCWNRYIYIHIHIYIHTYIHIYRMLLGKVV
jgi:hypothetical protein